MASNPYRIAHKSIIVPEYCCSMHYHECSTFDDPSTSEGRGPRRRLGVEVVNQSLGVSHHYRMCIHTSMRRSCPSLLANHTILDDNVLRYRQQLIDNVRQVLLNTTMLHHDNETDNVQRTHTAKSKTTSIMISSIKTSTETNLRTETKAQEKLQISYKATKQK